MKKYLLNLVLFIPFINSYSQTKCIIANYPFNGNANEIITYKSGILYGTKTTMDRFGQDNFALKFDGKDDYVKLTTDADFASRTISLWLNVDSFPTGGNFSLVFSSDNYNFKNGGTGIAVDNYGGNNRISIGIGSNIIRYNGAVKNKWYNCVVLTNNKYVKFYINGIIVDSTINNSNSHSSDGDTIAHIGCNRNGVANFFKGTVDDVKIYNCDLPKAQIDSLYRFNVPGCLLAYYKLNGNCNDYSGNDIHGSLIGTTKTNDRFGISQNAINLNGTNDMIKLGTKVDYKIKTISLWLKTDTFPTGGKYSLVFSSDNQKMENGGIGIAVDNSSGSNRISIGIGTNTLRYSGATKNKWYNCVILTNEKHVKFYLNGKIVDSTLNNSFSHSSDGDNVAYIGCNRNGTGNFFKGTIDDVKIYHCDLNYSEILKLYDYKPCSAEIITQPSNQNVDINKTASFSINSADSAATFQWQINIGNGYVDLTDTGQYYGSHSKNLKISNVSKTNNDNNLFRCIVKNSKCSDTSQIVKLSVLCTSIISNEPTDITSTNGGKAVFNITTIFSGSNYQWQINNGIGFKDLSNGGQYSGVTSNSLTIDDLLYSDNSSKLRCIAYFGGCIDSSKIAILTVNCNPIVKNHPMDQKIIRGKSAIYKVATYDIGTTFQWQIKNGLTFQNLSDAGQFSGTSTSELSVKSVTMSNNSQVFRCVLNYKGCSENSNDAALEVLCDKFISANPVTQTKYVGENAKFIVMTIEPNSTIIWQLNNGTGFSNLSNAGQYNGVTEDTLVVSNLTLSNDNFKFRCILSLDGCKDTSEVASLKVSCLPLVKTQPTDNTGYIGKNISFQISYNGTKLTKNWQTDIGLGFQNLSNAGQFDGVNTDTLKISNLTIQNDNQKFRCVLSDGVCNDTSKIVRLTVKSIGISNCDKSKIKIYPNPVNNNLFISMNDMQYNDISVKILNINGQLLFDEKLISKEMKIDMSNYNKGVYFVKILSPKVFEIRKIIKE